MHSLSRRHHSLRPLLPMILTLLAIIAVFAPREQHADASTTHLVSGGGSHDSGSHDDHNPGHIWLSVASPVGGTLSSGLRYHDGCHNLNADNIEYDACIDAVGGDFAIDVAGTGDAYLRVNYAGYASGYSLEVKPGTAIILEGYVLYEGNFSGSNAACDYQQIDIYVTWTSMSGTQRTHKVGQIVYAHCSDANWNYNQGDWIYSDASIANGNGTGGTIYYYANRKIGTVYNGDDGSDGDICSSGAHAHVEVYSYHSWGAEYEWWGEGPDYYVDYHVHGPVGPTPTSSTENSAYAASTPQDSVSGGTVVAFIGGGTNAFTIWENPGYGSH